MYAPSDPHTGRGMLIFAAVALVLALWMSAGRGDWAQSVLWYALAGVMACGGALFAGMAARWNRLLLVVGLVCGVIAFGSALWQAGIIR